MGWNERVHAHLGEILFYFFVKLSPLDSRRVRQDLEKLVARKALGAVRAYEIFGAYDLIVRAWLHPNLVSPFRSMLQGALRENLRSIHTFEVTNVDYRWYWEEKKVDPKVLVRIDQDIIRAAQQRGTNLDSLIESGLVTYRVSPSDERLIRFFTTVYLEDTHAYDDLTERIIEDLQSISAIRYLAIDRGFGFCSFLIKGEARDYFAISHVPRLMAERFRPSRVTTETFLCHDSGHFVGGEAIGEATFRAMQGKDLFFHSILPELYEHDGLVPGRKAEVEAFLTRLRSKTAEGLSLSESDKDLVHDCLLGYLKDRPTDTAKALFVLFMDTERVLRVLYKQFLGRAGVLRDALERARISTDTRKNLALGDVLSVLYHGGDILGESRLKWNGTEAFVTFRNKLVHGALDSVSLYDLENLIDLLPGLRLVLDTLMEHREKAIKEEE